MSMEMFDVNEAATLPPKKRKQLFLTEVDKRAKVSSRPEHDVLLDPKYGEVWFDRGSGKILDSIVTHLTPRLSREPSLVRVLIDAKSKSTLRSLNDKDQQISRLKKQLSGKNVVIERLSGAVEGTRAHNEVMVKECQLLDGKIREAQLKGRADRERVALLGLKERSRRNREEEVLVNSRCGDRRQLSLVLPRGVIREPLVAADCGEEPYNPSSDVQGLEDGEVSVDCPSDGRGDGLVDPEHLSWGGVLCAVMRKVVTLDFDWIAVVTPFFRLGIMGGMSVSY